MKKLETVLILKQHLQNDEIISILEEIKQIIVENKGVILEEKTTEKKLLAYPSKNNTHGFFVIISFVGYVEIFEKIQEYCKNNSDVFKNINVEH